MAYLKVEGVDPAERRRATEEVLAELGRYRGEVIVKGEHPLHAAVVRLEHLCRHDPARTSQPYKLDIGSSSIWFTLLRVSRTGSEGWIYTPVVRPVWSDDVPREGRAMWWARRLRDSLVAEVEALR